MVRIWDTANIYRLILLLYRDGVSVQMLEEKQVREDTQWKQLSASEKMKDWAIRHQYSLIIGGWATSLCITGAFIWRNKYVFGLFCCCIVRLNVLPDIKRLLKKLSRPVCGLRD